VAKDDLSLQGGDSGIVANYLNCSPKSKVDFFVAGVQKGGTTALASLLGVHPSIRMANRKEVHFFDDPTLDWQSPNYHNYHTWFLPSRSTTIFWGEATPIYFFQREALERIRRYNPDSKFIITLRHPSFRAHSHWRMETARGCETWDFSRAISPEGRSRCLFDDKMSRIFSYVERGFYAAQFRNLFDLFPRRQVLILRTDHLWLYGRKSLAEIWSFLGVKPLDRDIRAEYIVPSDNRWVGPMSSADRRYLDLLYRDEIARTRDLTGLRLGDWMDPDYEEPMPSPKDGVRQSGARTISVT